MGGSQASKSLPATGGISKTWTVLVYMAGDNGKIFDEVDRFFHDLTEHGWRNLCDMARVGSTAEVVGLADDIVARLEGKSSLGRIGLLIHSTAGFIDPGFTGQVTLELSNVANLPIAIYPGMKIGQISFYQLSTPAEHPYGSPGAGSKYQGQAGPTPSRIHRDFPEDQ